MTNNPRARPCCCLHCFYRWGSSVWRADKTMVLRPDPTLEIYLPAETEVYEAVVRDIVKTQHPEGRAEQQSSL